MLTPQQIADAVVRELVKQLSVVNESEQQPAVAALHSAAAWAQRAAEAAERLEHRLDDIGRQLGGLNGEQVKAALQRAMAEQPDVPAATVEPRAGTRQRVWRAIRDFFLPDLADNRDMHSDQR